MLVHRQHHDANDAGISAMQQTNSTHESLHNKHGNGNIVICDNYQKLHEWQILQLTADKTAQSLCTQMSAC